MRKLIRRLQNAAEVEYTRVKMRELERMYADAVARPGEDAGVRRRTLISFKRVINRLKEEIVLWETRGVGCGGS